MTLTESELLQARIAGMSNMEFDEWLAESAQAFNEAYGQGYHNGHKEGVAKHDGDWDDGYQVGYEEGKSDYES